MLLLAIAAVGRTIPKGHCIHRLVTDTGDLAPIHTRHGASGVTSRATIAAAQRVRLLALRPPPPVRWLPFVLLCAALPLLGAQQAPADPRRTEVWSPVPTVVTPGLGAAPPADAIVLFDGTDLSRWQGADGGPAAWIVGGGAMTVRAGAGSIQTRDAYGDCQLHLEWRTPAVVAGAGQDRGNSGVFLQGRYEVQVLDSWQNPTYVNGQAASVYKQHIPLVNASRGPGEWQSYDIIFHAPRFGSDGAGLTPATMTVLHNGVLVQDHVTIRGRTLNSGAQTYELHAPKEPLSLQDHHAPVSFRNIWIRPL